MVDCIVADIRASYEDWRREGAEFVTEPKDHILEMEIMKHMDFAITDDKKWEKLLEKLKEIKMMRHSKLNGY